jgi:DnaK suppressor protein
MLDKKIIEELKENLNKSREEIENNLKTFAKKDKDLKGDWDTKFPKWGEGGSGGAALESGADQVEQYGNMLPVEHNLETQLKDINLALEKIQKGTYGRCENCKKDIDEERLKAHPSARYCLRCGQGR